MRKMFLLFSHTITQTQVNDAQSSFGIEEFVTLPDELQTLWSSIPAEVESLHECLTALKSYIKKEVQREDIVLIQGDFGVVYDMVVFCKELKLTAVYATTKREVKEVLKDGKIIKTSLFQHVKYRKY